MIKLLLNWEQTNVFYNSCEILSKGIGVPESQLWFPEWIRFLYYK